MHRKGFVKLALETGAPLLWMLLDYSYNTVPAGSSLVPVFVFGERKAYHTSVLLTKIFSRFFKRLCNIGMPLPRGRWFTLMPFPGPITIVIGPPIAVPLTPKPSDELVDTFHARYVGALKALYDEHKVAAGYKDVALSVR